MLTEEQKEIVIENVNLAYKRANYWAKQLEWELEECISIAYIGLCKSVMGYDGSNKLSTLAYRVIDNEVLAEVRKENSKKRKVSPMVYIDEPIESGTPKETTLHELIGKHDDLNMREIYVVIENQLTDREKELIELYFFQEKTQKELAELYNRTQTTVAKHIHRLLEKIRILVGG